MKSLKQALNSSNEKPKIDFRSQVLEYENWFTFSKPR